LGGDGSGAGACVGAGEDSSGRGVEVTVSVIVFVAVTVTDDVTIEAGVSLLGVEQAARKVAVAAIAAATFPPCMALLLGPSPARSHL
ncbi:MAG: hypothetical protein WB777_07090, partial [Mycobacterium sp.]